MRWVKRGLWTAAWCFWLWLGVGLLHHLPKRQGELVLEFERSDGQSFLCFLHNGREFATLDAPEKFAPSVVRVWDVATGRVTRQFAGPRTESNMLNWDYSRQWPFIVTTEAYLPNRLEDSEGRSVAVLDLRDGRWSVIPSALSSGFGDFHEGRPWYLCGRDQEDATVSVVDLESKRVIFQRTPKPGWFLSEHFVHHFFVGDDHVAIETSRWPRFLEPSHKHEVRTTELHSLLEPRLPPKSYRHLSVGYGAESNGKRISWARQTRDSKERLVVFDLDQRRVVFDGPGSAPGRRHFDPDRMLSHDGRKLLDGGVGRGSARLIDVESGKVVWAADRNESAYNGDWRANRFESMQQWSFDCFGIQGEFRTFAVRSLDDGSLIVRSWDPVPNTIGLWSGEEPYHHTLDGIRRLDFQTDWPLLALCQTILALPLVLLWAALRWRRKRRLRLASAAP